MTYSPFRHIGSIFWKRRPIQLTFFVTRRCNSKCSFCFYLSHNKETGQRPPELSLAEIEKIAASMGDLLWLAFSGGEIFLREDLVDITRVFYERNRPAIILLPTNGLLTGTIREQVESILRSCPKSNIVVKLSIDGPEPIHDAIRGVKGGFSKTLRTYESLSELLDKYPNFDLGVNTVFCRANQENMQETFATVKRLDRIRTHTVSLIRGEASTEKQKEVDIEKYLQTINTMESDLKTRKAPVYGFSGARLKAAQDILQRRLIYETAVAKKRLIPCFAGKLNLVITETGDLYPCESFDMKMGNLRERGYDVDEILKSDAARKVNTFIGSKGCYCTHECYFMTNILFNPAQYPAILKEYLQL